MSLMSTLLRFARQTVQSVMSQLMQQLNVVQEQAYSPMQAMAQEVMGGIWTGKGADAFVEEVTGLMLPSTNRISDHISQMHKDIATAVDIIDRADEQVTTAVNGLGDLFGSIF